MARNELKTRGGLRDLGEIVLLLVVLSIDENVYGPFATRNDASSFAESADGSKFECRARLTSAREIEPYSPEPPRAVRRAQLLRDHINKSREIG